MLFGSSTLVQSEQETDFRKGITGAMRKSADRSHALFHHPYAGSRR